ncbi:hypothetical protein ABEB36_014824 [Hypothenemus hampei]|uniref:Uncharacterized protein n=1 Tax=Hypothenemus hampei TaxID=57062 RepID=A0ABD1E115_HYPHA
MSENELEFTVLGESPQYRLLPTVAPSTVDVPEADPRLHGSRSATELDGEVPVVDLTCGMLEEGVREDEALPSTPKYLPGKKVTSDGRVDENSNEDVGNFFKEFMLRRSSLSSVGEEGKGVIPAKSNGVQEKKRGRLQVSPQEESSKRIKHTTDSEKNKVFKVKGLINNMFRQVLTLEKIIIETRKPKKEIKDLSISLDKKVELIKEEGLESILQIALDARDA